MEKGVCRPKRLPKRGLGLNPISWLRQKAEAHTVFASICNLRQIGYQEHLKPDAPLKGRENGAAMRVADPPSKTLLLQGKPALSDARRIPTPFGLNTRSRD